jgi:hypothetical protein
MKPMLDLTTPPAAMRLYDFFDTLYQDGSEKVELDLAAMFGGAVYNALVKAALYRTSEKDFDGLLNYATQEKLEAFKERVLAGTYAVHNDGDPGPEQSIVFEFRVNGEQAAILYVRDNEHISAHGFTLLENAVRIWPCCMRLRLSDPRVELTNTPFAPHVKSLEDLGGWQSVVEHLARLYASCLMFLDDALECNRKTGKYGLGVKASAVLASDLVFAPSDMLKHRF